ncbi:MAG TPA: hypothetical protein VGF45_01435, partial [Polyangia bacterium]
MSDPAGANSNGRTSPLRETGPTNPEQPGNLCTRAPHARKICAGGLSAVVPSWSCGARLGLTP